jgi:hypothetical protein
MNTNWRAVSIIQCIFWTFILYVPQFTRAEPLMEPWICQVLISLNAVPCLLDLLVIQPQLRRNAYLQKELARLKRKKEISKGIK